MPLLRGGDRAGDKSNHDVRCVGSTLGEFQSGTAYVEYWFEHIEHPEYTISCRRALTPKSFSGFVAKELRDAFGWDPRENRFQFEALAAGADSPLAGVVCSIVVEEEEYEGTLRARVLFVNKPGGPRERLDEDKARTVSERIRNTLRGGARTAPPPSASRGPASGPPSRDSIRQAAGEGAARARGEKPAAAAPPADADEYDFDDIPF